MIADKGVELTKHETNNSAKAFIADCIISSGQVKNLSMAVMLMVFWNS